MEYKEPHFNKKEAKAIAQMLGADNSAVTKSKKAAKPTPKNKTKK